MAIRPMSSRFRSAGDRWLAPRQTRLRRPEAEHRVKADRPASCGGEIETAETENDCESAFVDRRVEAVREMLDEIGKRHLSRQDESNQACQETDHQHAAEHELDHAGSAPQ